MKEVLAYALMCPNSECKCVEPIANGLGGYGIFRSKVEAQLAASKLQPVPKVSPVRIYV